MKTNDYIDVIFDGPPSHVTGRLVEVENSMGASINAGDWIDNGDGTWTLRIRTQVFQSAIPKPEANPHLKGAEDYENLKAAAVQATLALAYEQRTANLIALNALGRVGEYDANKSAWRDIELRLGLTA